MSGKFIPQFLVGVAKWNFHRKDDRHKPTRTIRSYPRDMGNFGKKTSHVAK